MFKVSNYLNRFPQLFFINIFQEICDRVEISKSLRKLRKYNPHMVVLNRPCLIEILSKSYNLGITCANGWIFATQNSKELELTKLELSGL